MKGIQTLLRSWRLSKGSLTAVRQIRSLPLAITQSQCFSKPSLFTSQPTSSFSTSSPHLARKKQGPKRDQRISIIRYHLQHPINPRPLRFSRMRHLRHWTIHRAWQLYRTKLRNNHQLCLERQYNSMRAACEALRLCGEDGLSIAETPPSAGRDVKGLDVMAAAEKQREVGKLFRVAMLKGGIWDGVPIEYARSQTETPPRAGWDHAWTR